MNCDEAILMLYDLVDEELTDEDEKLLRVHLSKCSACQAELESIRAAEALYRREMAISPPKGIEERIVSAVWDGSRSLQPQSPFYRSPYVRAAIIGTVACILAAAVYFVGKLPETSLLTSRIFEVVTSIDPKQWPQQWLESLRSITEINFFEIFSQSFNKAIEALSAIEASVPSVGGYTIAICLSLIALQIVGSYRLLGNKSELTTKN